ncbi:hypothetical protein FRB94_006291 [Tulasnella sp. JGI-2019a]|nr:hypothetical protein FRB94_006291 [Tulasnella sp. JGI-2019a]
MHATKKILRRHSSQASVHFFNKPAGTGGVPVKVKADDPKTSSFVDMIENFIHGRNDKMKKRYLPRASAASCLSMATSAQDLLPYADITSTSAPQENINAFSPPDTLEERVVMPSPPVQVRPVSTGCLSENTDLDRARAAQLDMYAMVIKMGDSARMSRGCGSRRAKAEQGPPTLPVEADVFATEGTVRDGRKQPASQDVSNPAFFEPIYIPAVEEIVDAQVSAIAPRYPRSRRSGLVMKPTRDTLASRLKTRGIDQVVEVKAELERKTSGIVRKLSLMREIMKHSSAADLGVAKILASAGASPFKSSMQKTTVPARKQKKYILVDKFHFLLYESKSSALAESNAASVTTDTTRSSSTNQKQSSVRVNKWLEDIPFGEPCPRHSPFSTPWAL